MYCLNMLKIALQLANTDVTYEDIASKFFEHFLYISYAVNHSKGTGLWDEEDQFYYDSLQLPDGRMISLRIRSMVGLIPLFAVETLEPELLDRLPLELRECLVLREIEDCSYKEIARIIDAPIGTVKWRLFAARRRLKRLLQ